MRHDDNTTSLSGGRGGGGRGERERKKRKSVVKGATGRESDFGKDATSYDLKRHHRNIQYVYIRVEMP